MVKTLFFIWISLSCLKTNESIMYDYVKTILTLCSQPPIWFSYASGFASLIAFIISILYFIKPRLSITNETTGRVDKNFKIRIRCTNINCIPITVKDVKCDIVLSKDNSFTEVDTINLSKDWIPGIKHKDFYIFKSGKDLNNDEKLDDKKWMKIRILCINVLGVKKYYEKVFSLS